MISRISCLAFAVCLSILMSWCTCPAATPPNIIFILADDLGWVDIEGDTAVLDTAVGSRRVVHPTGADIGLVLTRGPVTEVAGTPAGRCGPGVPAVGTEAFLGTGTVRGEQAANGERCGTGPRPEPEPSRPLSAADHRTGGSSCALPCPGVVVPRED